MRYGREVLGRRQPWSVDHRGLEYPGEVVVAEAVDPDLGLPLEGELCFRVVFYTVPRRIPTSQLRDPRITMAVPRRTADPTGESLSREALAIREASRRYIAGGDSESIAIRDTMAEREDSLLIEVARRQMNNYAQGRIYTQGGVTVRPVEEFAHDRMDMWVRQIVEDVLEETFPILPFEHGAFLSTLTAEKVAVVFRGLFQGDAGSAETAAAFGPALGLSAPDSPALFDGEDCAVLGVIEEALASQGGEMDAEAVLDLLCRGHGLTRALSTLYLMAFVRSSHAGLGLRSGRGLRSRQGGPLPSDRITWDLLADLDYSETPTDMLGTLQARQPLTWNVALPYATLVADGLDMAGDEAQIADQEDRLVKALGEMRERIERARRDVNALASDLGDGVDDPLSELDSLLLMCSATGYRSFYTVAAESFASPSGLGRALDLHTRLETLATMVSPISSANAYLIEMTFGRPHQELAVRRDTVAAMIGLDSLLANPSLWRSVEESFRRLVRDYSSTYLSHHARYHQESIELLTVLERLATQVDALSAFDRVPEFGGPLGTDAPERYRELVSGLRTCQLSADRVSVADAPSCSSCGLSLDEEIPRREAASVVRDIEGGIREYNRRLSSEGVRLVLAHPDREHLDKLLDLARLGDLSSLANVLDADVMEFLRGFVRPG